MLDSRPKGRGFEPHVVSLSKNNIASLVLVQPRKTHPFITERLLMGCKESNQTKKSSAYFTEVKWSISKKSIIFKVPEGVQHFPGGSNYFQVGGGGGPIAYSL